MVNIILSNMTASITELKNIQWQQLIVHMENHLQF